MRGTIPQGLTAGPLELVQKLPGRLQDVVGGQARLNMLKGSWDSPDWETGPGYSRLV